MPELPEVETIVRGIKTHILNKTIYSVNVYQSQLRWLIPKEIKNVCGEKINHIYRRGKYIIIELNEQKILIHLGMSGVLRVVTKNALLEKHDHIEWVFKDKILRLNDPRRFGCVLWTDEDIKQHKLIKHLGIEPLLVDFTADYLFKLSRNKQVAIKQFIMNSKIVVGIGNIYASESLFLSAINPKIKAGRVSMKRYSKLVTAIKKVLTKAIKEGGTTLKDFSSAEGKPGYFGQHLNVYGQANKPCQICETKIKKITQNKRASYYCPKCQK